MSFAALLLAVSVSAQSPTPAGEEEPPQESAAPAEAAPAEATAAHEEAPASPPEAPAAAAETPTPPAETPTTPAEAPAPPTPPAPAEAPAAVKPKPKPAPRLHVVIHPDAKDWEPLSLRAGGDPARTENSVVLRQVRSKGKLKGVGSKAKSAARVVVSKNDRWLVISVFPKALEKRRSHFEVRFRVVEGFVEDVKVQAVSVADPRPGSGAGLDSYALRAAGIEFQEDSPGSGRIAVSALDARPGKATFNAGKLQLGEFADRDIGFADVSWSTRGLAALK